MVDDLVHKGVGLFHRFAPIIHDIKKLLAREWTVSLPHTYHKGNNLRISWRKEELIRLIGC